ncbi:hypothetical protein MHU86_23812 [Fragilaria crotonensis]|nr:hypothetical protein MHU86_23812 [Fragilaria crotonensis]
MTCTACHSPPALDPPLGLLPVSPDGNARPYIYGYGMAPAGLEFRTIDYQDIITERPDILDTDEDLPEFSPNHQEAYVVRSLSRSALRMLWHQRLGHINFRRLSEMHRFVKGMPQFKLPTELEECPICLAAKLRRLQKEQGPQCGRQLATKACQSTLVSWSKRAAIQSDTTLVGLNGETCYVLLTDHFSGRIFGRAFPTKAPPVDWINSWLASNAPNCPDKYVRMDGVANSANVATFTVPLRTLATQLSLLVPTRHTKMDLANDHTRQSAMHFVPCFLARIYNQTSGHMHSTITSDSTTLFPMATDRRAHTKCGAPLPNLAKLRTFGCRMHVRPTTARYGRVVPNSRLGTFLGYSRSLKVMYYFDLASSTVKTATHARFDEGMNDLSEPPPNVKLLRNLADDGVIEPDRLDLPLLNLDVSDDPFDRLDELSPHISCEHPSLGFEIKECHIRKRGFVSGVIPNTTASRIRNVRRKYIGAFVVSINDVAIVFAPDRYIPVTDRHLDQPLHLSVDQLRTISSINSSPSTAESIDNDVARHDNTDELDDDHVQLLLRSLNTTTHGTSEEQGLGSFTRRKLRRLPNWKEWQAAEFKQLDSMAKQEMYGALSPHQKMRLSFVNIGTTPSKVMALARRETVATDPSCGTSTKVG